MFLDDLLNGARKQMAAPFADVIVFARDWGFRLEEVKIPVRATVTASSRSPMGSMSSAGCLTRSSTRCPGRAISLGWALPRKFCTL